MGMPVTLRCNPGETVDTPPDVCPVMVFEFDHCFNNGLGRKTCCCVVKVNNIPENREILPYLVDCKSCTRFFLPFSFPLFSLPSYQLSPGWSARSCPRKVYDHHSRRSLFELHNSLILGGSARQRQSPHVRMRSGSPFLSAHFSRNASQRCIFGLDNPEFLIFTFKHRRAKVASDAFESFIIRAG